MRLEFIPLEDVPLLGVGDDLAGALATALGRSNPSPSGGDVLVVCQKIVSRTEGRILRLDDVEPSEFARRFATAWEKDPRVVEVVLRESRRIVRMERGHLIVETHHGFVCANAGIDESNALEKGTVVLLPEDPDGSARRLRNALRERGFDLAVLLSDTFGRPWRLGQLDVAVGCAGMAPILDMRGRPDLSGRPLEHTEPAVADALTAAAGLLMEKAGATPAVLVRGWRVLAGDTGARALLREPGQDLFR